MNVISTTCMWTTHSHHVAYHSECFLYNLLEDRSLDWVSDEDEEAIFEEGDLFRLLPLPDKPPLLALVLLLVLLLLLALISLTAWLAVALDSGDNDCACTFCSGVVFSEPLDDCCRWLVRKDSATYCCSRAAWYSLQGIEIKTDVVYWRRVGQLMSIMS